MAFDTTLSSLLLLIALLLPLYFFFQLSTSITYPSHIALGISTTPTSIN